MFFKEMAKTKKLQEAWISSDVCNKLSAATRSRIFVLCLKHFQPLWKSLNGVRKMYIVLVYDASLSVRRISGSYVGTAEDATTHHHFVARTGLTNLSRWNNFGYEIEHIRSMYVDKCDKCWYLSFLLSEYWKYLREVQNELWCYKHVRSWEGPLSSWPKKTSLQTKWYLEESLPPHSSGTRMSSSNAKLFVATPA